MFRLRTFVTFFGGLVVLVFVSRPLLTTVHNRVGKLALGTIPASGSLLGTKQKTSKGSQPVNNEYGKPPIYFEPNLGQTDPQVKFMARGGGGTTFLTATEAVFSLPVGGHSRDRTSPSAKAGGGNPDPVPTLTDLIGMGGVGLGHRARDLALGVLDSRPFRREFQSAQSTIGNRQSAIRMKLVGANPETQIEGLDRLPGISNYFIGNDPAKWRRNIPHYAKVRYREVYPGIDMAYYGQQEQLEYDLIVAPGADPEVIEIAYEGAESMELDSDGTLLVQAGGMRLRHRVPVVYQLAGREKRKIDGRYRFKNEHRIRFELGEYDMARTLIIDPVLGYETTLTSGELPYVVEAIAVDSMGNAYLTGQTSPLGVPTTPGSFQTVPGGSFDTFVTKLNPTGTAIVYTTYLGGDSEDAPSSLAVDPSGNAYVSGTTYSASFPVTPGSFSRFHSGGINTDVFVSKLNPSGSNLVYSTYLGGNSGDYSRGIAVDALGRAFVGGHTSSSDFPTTLLAFQRTIRGEADAFVTQLNPAGTGLIYSTLLGGSRIDVAGGIALDLAGSVYLTGGTASEDFPVTPGALQGTHGGGGFAAKLNAGGTALAYSTFLSADGNSLAVDSQGNAYVASSEEVTKINSSGSAKVFSTTLAGGDRIAIDGSGAVYTLLVGPNPQTLSTSVLTTLSPSGDSVLSTRLFGGFDPWIQISAFALGSDGSLYLTGRHDTDAYYQCGSGGLHVFFRSYRGYVSKTGVSDETTLTVPIVLSAAGLNGSFFTSELTLANRGTTDARLDFAYSAAFGEGSGTASDTLPRGQQRIFPDAVGYLRSLGILIPTSGNLGGTLRIRFSGLSSPAAAAASARTTTAVPGGRAGLAYSAIPSASALTGTVYLAGLRQTSNDRSNVAIQNLGSTSDGDVVLRLTVLSGNTSAPAEQVLPEERLSPGGFRQINGILTSNGLSLTQGYVRVERVSGSAPYYAYAVINDQITSDGSFVPPVSQYDAEETRSLMIPVVVRSDTFSSEVILTNWLPETRKLTLRFVAEAIQTETKATGVDIELAPQQQLVIPDIVQFLRDSGAPGLDPAISYAGSLFVEKRALPCCFKCLDTRSFFAGARTSAPGGGGRFGVFYPAVPVRSAFANTVWIFGLRQDAENRTNLAFAHPGFSANAEHNPLTLRVDLFDGDTGLLVTTLEGITLRFSEWKQINSVLATYAPGVRSGYARITRSGGKDPFFAYAVINDGAIPGERATERSSPVHRERIQAPG